MRIIITFTNIQIVRNYLYDSDLDLLHKLNFSECLLVCNNSTFEAIKKHISNLSLDQQKKITILLIDYPQKNIWIRRLFNTIFKSHVSSKFALNKIFKSRSKNEITWTKLFMRLFIYFTTYKNKYTSWLLRYFYRKFFVLLEDFDLLLEYSDYDIAVTLSLTDDLDVYVSMFAHKNNIKNIGTVRSWDNLTSHGLLRVKPDVFYCHSSSMADDLFRFQFFNPQNDLVEIGFSNWINFNRVSIIRSKSKTLNKKILYGSMGVYFNPSEIALIDYLYEFKSVLKSNQVSLTVLMHPKFTLPIDVQNRYSDFITFFSFKFDNFDESSSYSDYLEYLSQFDLILSSGSTLLLDACLINKNIAHVNFELTSVPFWESIKRYLDFREYYMKFIALSKTPLINSTEDLEAFFKLEYASTHQKTAEQDFASRYILGDQNQKSLIELIKCSVLR